MPTTDYVGYERLREALPLALAGGESIQDRGAARDLVDRAGVDIIQPDVSICGGIGETLWIAGLARLGAIETYPHACNGALSLAATPARARRAPGPEPPARRRAAPGARLRPEPRPNRPSAQAARSSATAGSTSRRDPGWASRSMRPSSVERAIETVAVTGQ